MTTSKTRAKQQTNLDFKLMSFTYKLRDIYRPRMNILKEVGIKTGFHVLDYGCGPGSYIRPLAKLVGESGTIYALDINPLAIQAVQGIVSKKQLKNVRTILSNCKTELPSDSLDVVLLYDILHDLDNASAVISELHRILKPQGILSVSDHHLKQDEITSAITSEMLFGVSVKGKRTHSFNKKL
jgi:ubiquinone/menaquinone biosynthesis C-methylase UbiE